MPKRRRFERRIWQLALSDIQYSGLSDLSRRRVAIDRRFSIEEKSGEGKVCGDPKPKI